MIKFLSSLFVVLALAITPAIAQVPTAPAAPVAPEATAPVGAADSPNKVAGLELPADQTVGFDEGFVNIQAQCKGEVKWLVVASVKVKFVQVPGNALILSIPPQPTVITVFAIGIVDGKMTEFARTNIQVNGQGPNPPGPNPPGPNPPGPVAGPVHVTFLIDMNQTTPEIAQLLNSQNLRTGITSKGNFFRIYDIKSPVVAQKKLDAVAARVGGNSVIIIQSNAGQVLAAQVIPGTEQEILQLVSRLSGGR